MAYDSSIPIFTLSNESDSIVINIPQTQAKVKEQNYTYNKSGATYNQPGVFYGGVYHFDEDNIPLLVNSESEKPYLTILDESTLIKLKIPQTKALTYQQENTYNQSGATYNQVGIAYGGVYNYNEDTVPIELSFVDTYTQKPKPPTSNFSIGPGWFMFVTQ